MFPEMPLEFEPPAPAQKTSKHIDVHGRLKFPKGVVHPNGTEFTDGTSFAVNLSDLEDQGILGRGQFATVGKFRHRRTGVVMAVKRIRLEMGENTFNNVLTELSVLHDNESPYIVDFYGAFFIESHIYYCVEYMDIGSLDKVYGAGIPEPALSKIAFSVVSALLFLHDELKIIHRDVRPSNILLNSKGEVKVCDFNVSGNLENSLAKSVVGCERYMSPERILASKDRPYGVSSDLWSLGLSLIEMATGNFPYSCVNGIFALLDLLLKTDPPSLPREKFSPEFCDFVSSCLAKDHEKRATLNQLACHPFLTKYPDYDIRTWIETIPRPVKQVSQS